MITIYFLIVLTFSSTITGNPLPGKNGHQVESDVNQWSSVPEVDESSMMQMLNSIMEMIRSQLSSWMMGSRSGDEVEVDGSANRGFMSMIHGLFSRLSNMAMDMMGQMRRMRDKTSKERLQETPSVEGESDLGSTNSSTLATRLRNQMETTRERIKGAWNSLMKKYNDTVGSSMAMMTMMTDDESKVNRNLRSDNRRVIRSLDSSDDDQIEILKSGYINSVEPKVFDKLVSMVDRLSDKNRFLQDESRQFDSLIAAPSNDERTDDPGRSRNLFDRMRGAMDNARSKFFGAIGKFMNGTMMNEADDDSTNLTEDDPKNWWQMFKPKSAINPSKIPEREPLSPPSSMIPTKANYPSSSMIPKESPKIGKNYPDLLSIPSSYKPHVDWTVKSRPKSTVDLGEGGADEPSRTTIEFMDKFKDEMDMVRSSMGQSSNDNLEMAMTKMANWGLFMRSISESKNLDDFWGKLTQTS